MGSGDFTRKREYMAYMVLKYVIKSVICVDKYIHYSHNCAEIHIQYRLDGDDLCAQEKRVPLGISKTRFDFHDLSILRLLFSIY